MEAIWKKTLKDRFVKELEREVEKIAKKAVKKDVASVPVAGWIFTVGFMVADIARGENVVDSVVSNIPYVGIAYDTYRITADIIEAENAFEDQFFQNADSL